MEKKLICNLLLTAIISTAAVSNLSSQEWNQFRGPNRDCRVTGFIAPEKWPAGLKQVWKVTGGTGDASPVIAGNRVYVHTRQGTEEALLCLDAATGKELWKSSYPSPAVTGPAASHPGPRGTPSVSAGKVVSFGAAAIL